jgi:hypothetical protein
VRIRDSVGVKRWINERARQGGDGTESKRQRLGVGDWEMNDGEQEKLGVRDWERVSQRMR